MPCAWFPYGTEQVAMLVQDASILHNQKLVFLGLVGCSATPGPRRKPHSRRAFGRRLTDVSGGRVGTTENDDQIDGSPSAVPPQSSCPAAPE
jgi:hypothetical protein